MAIRHLSPRDTCPSSAPGPHSEPTTLCPPSAPEPWGWTCLIRVLKEALRVLTAGIELKHGRFLSATENDYTEATPGCFCAVRAFSVQCEGSWTTYSLKQVPASLEDCSKGNGMHNCPQELGGPLSGLPSLLSDLVGEVAFSLWGNEFWGAGSSSAQVREQKGRKCQPCSLTLPHGTRS